MVSSVYSVENSGIDVIIIVVVFDEMVCLVIVVMFMLFISMNVLINV